LKWDTNLCTSRTTSSACWEGKHNAGDVKWIRKHKNTRDDAMLAIFSFFGIRKKRPIGRMWIGWAEWRRELIYCKGSGGYGVIKWLIYGNFTFFPFGVAYISICFCVTLLGKTTCTSHISFPQIPNPLLSYSFPFSSLSSQVSLKFFFFRSCFQKILFVNFMSKILFKIFFEIIFFKK